MNSESFITENPVAFTDRYDGAADYFERLDQPDELTVSHHHSFAIPLPL